MTSDLYNRIIEQLDGTIDRLADTKLPDEYQLDRPVVVYSVIDAVPTITIDSRIALTDSRVQFTVLAQDLDDARAVNTALVAALQGWRGALAGLLTYESGGPELYLDEMNPPCYQVSSDFMQTITG